jgi:outer membrane biosynthesis protein TonB
MKKTNKYHPGNLFKYLAGRFSGKERHQLEKEMQKDPFLEDAHEGLSMLSPKEVEEDISTLNKRIRRQSGLSNHFILYRLAAAIAIMLFVSSLFVVLYYSRPFLEENEIAIAEVPEEKVEEIILPGLKEESPAESTREIESQDKREIAGPARPVTETIRPEADVATSKGEELKITEEKQAEKTDHSEPVVSRYRAASAPEAVAQPLQTASDKSGLISGVVISSEDGLPIPGASVLIKGTTSVAITNADGKFNLILPEGDDKTLIIAFIGMDAKEIQAISDEEMKIVLEPNLLALEEVVVTGYGVSRKKAVSTSSGMIDYDDLYLHPDFSSAVPVTGNRGFTKYVNENVQFPENTSQKRAVVVLSFTVNADGRPDNISVLRSPGMEFSAEAIRLLQEGPDWQPAKIKDEMLDIVTQIRIVLKK